MLGLMNFFFTRPIILSESSKYLELCTRCLIQKFVIFIVCMSRKNKSRRDTNANLDDSVEKRGENQNHEHELRLRNSYRNA